MRAAEDMWRIQARGRQDITGRWGTLKSSMSQSLWGRYTPQHMNTLQCGDVRKRITDRWMHCLWGSDVMSGFMTGDWNSNQSWSWSFGSNSEVAAQTVIILFKKYRKLFWGVESLIGHVWSTWMICIGLNYRWVQAVITSSVMLTSEVNPMSLGFYWNITK